MPVRSLNSSVLRWPDHATVDRAARAWAKEVAGARRDVVRIGYFGSYARGDWGVGSDLDLVIMLDRSLLPFHRRSLEWDATVLPVPADVLVYTQEEWETLEREGGFPRSIGREIVWIYVRGVLQGKGIEG
ncbi:MAG: nucleotidyltransferase domain-containing protein [Chloroflexi bacterium]|nr:nucleotidyltransferase domain-containing protein [Chloroflexota bacterium]